jgi:hypothetical protein
LRASSDLIRALALVLRQDHDELRPTEQHNKKDVMPSTVVTDSDWECEDVDDASLAQTRTTRNLLGTVESSIQVTSESQTRHVKKKKYDSDVVTSFHPAERVDVTASGSPSRTILPPPIYKAHIADFLLLGPAPKKGKVKI